MTIWYRAATAKGWCPAQIPPALGGIGWPPGSIVKAGSHCFGGRRESGEKERRHIRRRGGGVGDSWYVEPAEKSERRGRRRAEHDREREEKQVARKTAVFGLRRNPK